MESSFFTSAPVQKRILSRGLLGGVGAALRGTDIHS